MELLIIFILSAFLFSRAGSSKEQLKELKRKVKRLEEIKIAGLTGSEKEVQESALAQQLIKEVEEYRPVSPGWKAAKTIFYVLYYAAIGFVVFILTL